MTNGRQGEETREKRERLVGRSGTRASLLYGRDARLIWTERAVGNRILLLVSCRDEIWASGNKNS